VTADGRLVLIDFEVSSLAADRARADLAHPGYGAPGDRVGVDVDRYALACLHLGMFAPQTTIPLSYRPAKARELGRLVTQAFPVPPSEMDAAVRTILGPEPTDETPAPALPAGRADWPDVRDALRRAILASATPERDDRLFPGDALQFEPGGGLGLAYGAAGVLYALAVTGAGCFPEHEEWLRRHVLAGAEAGPGFYDGLHGVAYTLETLGRRQDALDTVDLTLGTDWAARELNLWSGLAGVGLNLLHLGGRTGEVGLTDLAYRIVELTAERLGGPDDVPEISGGHHPNAGLLYGSSGPALLLLHAYERTGDPALLDRAADALRQDLRRCTWAGDGTLQVDQGWRTLPYLGEGSVGIALVLHRYLSHRADEEFATALDGLRRVTRCGFFVMPGLFRGRSGLLAAHAMLTRAGGEPDAQTTELIRWLAWHSLPYGGGLAFPGEQLMRLSMDFATGTAGVLFALGTALHDAPVFLPFSEPAAAPRR
jgi:hypothetical protein